MNRYIINRQVQYPLFAILGIEIGFSTQYMVRDSILKSKKLYVLSTILM
jgi:hypothetical protein